MKKTSMWVAMCALTLIFASSCGRPVAYQYATVTSVETFSKKISFTIEDGRKVENYSMDKHSAAFIDISIKYADAQNDGCTVQIKIKPSYNGWDIVGVKEICPDAPSAPKLGETTYSVEVTKEGGRFVFKGFEDKGVTMSSHDSVILTTIFLMKGKSDRVYMEKVCMYFTCDELCYVAFNPNRVDKKRTTYSSHDAVCYPTHVGGVIQSRQTYQPSDCCPATIINISGGSNTLNFYESELVPIISFPEPEQGWWDDSVPNGPHPSDEWEPVDTYTPKIIN